MTVKAELSEDEQSTRQAEEWNRLRNVRLTVKEQRKTMADIEFTVEKYSRTCFTGE